MPRLRSLFICSLALLAPVGASAAVPAELDDGLRVGTLDEAGLHRAPLESLTPAVLAGEFPDTTSLLVFRHGRLVHERYFGSGGIHVLNDTRSATKTVTALAVGRALADGSLRSAEQSAFDLLPDLAPFQHDGALKRGITLMDLLTMSSALECDDFVAANAGNEENMYPLANWSRWAADLPVKADYRRNASGRGAFSYCTGGTLLLGQVVQRAARMPLDRYVDDRLFRPMGIRERQWSRSPSGEFMSGGGLRLRSRDLLKLGVLLAGNGHWNGVQLVPEAWVKRMRTVSNVVDDDQSYGMLLWQRQYRSACGAVNGWYMSGNGGNVVLNVPLKSLVAVVTRTHYNQRGMHDQTTTLLEKHVLAALTCTAN
jgi:CubicO group peptidase (beta-lactamase class C family)